MDVANRHGGSMCTKFRWMVTTYGCLMADIRYPIALDQGSASVGVSSRCFVLLGPWVRWRGNYF